MLAVARVGHASVLHDVVVQHDDIAGLHTQVFGGLPDRSPDHDRDIPGKRLAIPIRGIGLNGIVGITEFFRVRIEQPVLCVTFR